MAYATFRLWRTKGMAFERIFLVAGTGLLLAYKISLIGGMSEAPGAMSGMWVSARFLAGAVFCIMLFALWHFCRFLREMARTNNEAYEKQQDTGPGKVLVAVNAMEVVGVFFYLLWATSEVQAADNIYSLLLAIPLFYGAVPLALADIAAGIFYARAHPHKVSVMYAIGLSAIGTLLLLLFPYLSFK